MRKNKRVAFGTSLKRLWGKLAYCAAWLLTPSPTAALLIVCAVIMIVMRFMHEGG